MASDEQRPIISPYGITEQALAVWMMRCANILQTLALMPPPASSAEVSALILETFEDALARDVQAAELLPPGVGVGLGTLHGLLLQALQYLEEIQNQKP